MNNRSIRRALGLAVAFLLAAAGGRGVCEQPAALALEPIFNGRDLAGWQPTERAMWRVENGVLIGENDAALTGSMLKTEAEYGDVVVEADVRFEGEIDSGIMLRNPEIQVQIGISSSLKRDMTCCFYTGRYPETGLAEGVNERLRPGEWNHFRVEAVGDTFTVWLNGKQVAEYTDPKYAAPGPIGLQVHPNRAMKVEFRNVRARRL